MKKKLPKKVNDAEVLVQIQEQLAALNNKLDDFINKSLTDLAQTLAIQKAAAAQRTVQAAPQAAIRPMQQQNIRPKYAIVCFQCGKDSELPFKPVPGRPVYCPECFAMRKAGNAHQVSHAVKPSVEVAAPVEVKAPSVKSEKKGPAPKKVVKKKTVAKKKAKK